MKKLSISLLVMLLIASLFTSCSMGSDDASDVRVKVRLTPSGGGRSLTTDIETINLDDDSITWHYSATKVTEKQFNYGATSDSILPKDGIVTLSQGEWTIGLWGIKDGKKVYAGTTSNVTIKWNFYEPNVTVPVTVKQNTGDYGYIVLTDVKIPVNEELKTPNFASIDSTIIMNFNGVNMRLECIPGPHTVTFEYRSDDGAVKSSKSLVVEVISGRETTISGNIDKSEITSGSSSLTEVKQAIEVKKEGDTVVNALVAPANTSSNLNQTTVTFPQGSLPEETTTAVLNLSVKSAGEFSVTSSGPSSPVAGIDVSLLVNGNEVSSFNNQEVVIETYIAKNLTDVSVNYNGTDGGQPTLVSYDSISGKLVFTTTHFSSFIVETSSVALIGDTAYSNLYSAIFAAKSNEKILLLNDCTLSQYVYFGKNITIDLNRNKISKYEDDDPNTIYPGYFIVDKGTEMTFINGEMEIMELEVRHGTLNLIGVNVTSDYSIYVSGSNDETTKEYSVVNIDSNSTLNVPTYFAIAIYDYQQNWSRGYGIEVNVDGIINSLYGIVISGNYGTKSNVTFNLNTGSSINTGLYVAANSTWNISGKVEGTIYQKCGTVNIFETAKIYTNQPDDDEYGWAHYGSGYFTEGSCYIVESCNYPGGVPTANIYGGSFNKGGENAFNILVINWKKDDAATFKGEAVINSSVPYYKTKEVITGHESSDGETEPTDGWLIFSTEGENANVELINPTNNN